MRWETGISSSDFSGLNYGELYECKQAGIRLIEISRRWNEYTFDWDQIKKDAQRAGITFWSLHLPFENNVYNPAHLDRQVRENTIKKDIELMEKASVIGIKNIVLHASSEPIAEYDRAKSMDYAKDSILQLNDYAKNNNMTLCIENLPRTCIGKNSEEMLDILSIDPDIQICFDTNHLLSESHSDFIKKVGHRIATVHISDYDFIDERHQIPGTGKIDWDELLNLLYDVGYRGPFLYEASYKKENKNVLDLKNNHEMLEKSAFRD